MFEQTHYISMNIKIFPKLNANIASRLSINEIEMFFLKKIENNL